MQSKELTKEWLMTYHELLAYLKNKYGPVPKNYFCNESCKSKSSGITRTSDGLFIHHDFEYDPEDKRVCNLSEQINAQSWPWKYQLAENLTYCNWLEHLLLHIKINLLRKEQLGFYINDGVINYFLPELNKLYTYQIDIDSTPSWKLMCFTIIEDDYDDYCWMVNEWFKLIGFEDTDWKNY